MAMVTKTQLLQIETFARDFYSHLDFAHSIDHGERVVANARAIQSIEGGDLDLVLAGAWLHQFHDNLDDLKLGLQQFDLPSDTADQLFQIVQACRPQLIASATSIEARIVFDADALDLIGPFGTIREVLCNFHYRKMGWQESVESCQQVQTLFTEKLQTKTARQISSEGVKINSKFWRIYRAESRASDK